jgi:hypothetical protein
MSPDRVTDQIDESLLSRLARLSPESQRWLKTALQVVRTMPSPNGGDLDDYEAEPAPEPAPVPRRIQAPVAEPPDEVAEPLPELHEDEPSDPRSGLEDVITGRAGLDEQLEAYPELAGELEGLGDIIDMLRSMGKKRRKRGEQILREEVLGEPSESEYDEDDD